MIPNIGELAALLTAVSFSATSILFSRAGKIFGSFNVNRLRLVTAVVLLILIHWIFLGEPIPLNAGIERWLWLGSSGVIGLAIGDLFLFQAYITIGPRLGVLFLSMAPALATVLAWVMLGETLSMGNIIGIVITLAGIAWVVLEGNREGNPDKEARRIDKKSYSRGILAGLLAAIGQALGMVLAKNGLAGDFPALSGNVIRMTTAFLAIWTVTLIQGQLGATTRLALHEKRGLLYILAGSIMGPVIGVSLSLFAIQHTNIGIASTLIALPPVFLLPVSHFIFKEKITWQSVAGTVLAMAGVAILFWL